MKENTNLTQMMQSKRPTQMKGNTRRLPMKRNMGKNLRTIQDVQGSKSLGMKEKRNLGQQGDSELGLTPFRSFFNRLSVLRTSMKEIAGYVLTKVTIWPNRDDSDHVLVITIEVDSRMGDRSGRAFCFDPSKNHEALDLYLSCSWTADVI
jgi:hypothetical protein